MAKKAVQPSKTETRKSESEKQKKVIKTEVAVEVAPVVQEKLEEKPKTSAKAGDSPTKPLAKSGKRSAKAIAEVEVKQEKAERKAKSSDLSDEASAKAEAKKHTQKPPRSKLERASKKFREAAKLIEKDKVYTLVEALDLATKTSITKFDATVELHVNLGVDPKQADQNVRGIVTLPEGTGKPVRVAVVADADEDKKAQAAGADLVGADKILADLDKEKVEFDVLVATPKMMPTLSKYARLLGPKGLMPNPKSGTVTADIAKAVTESKAGRVEYRVDSNGIIHMGVGKVSFGGAKLSKNAQVIIDAIKAAKPASQKGIYIKSAYVSTTMGPGIKTNV